jgi:hypothetical protein
MTKPDLDPHLFSELEIEAITGHVSPWRRVKRIAGACLLGGAAGVIGVVAALCALHWLLDL